MDRNKIRMRVCAAVRNAEGLRPDDVEAVMDLVEGGEYALALDTLCTQIYQYDVEISKALWIELEDLGSKLEVPARYLLGDPWADPSPDGRTSLWI